MRDVESDTCEAEPRGQCVPRQSPGTRGGASVVWPWLALLALLAVSGCRQNAKAEGAAADDETAKPIVTVTVKPVVRTALDETVEVLGTTQPLRSRTARVTTAIEGRVAEILPEARDVERGDTNRHATLDVKVAGDASPLNPVRPGSPQAGPSFNPSTSSGQASGEGRSVAADPRPPTAVEGQMVTERQVIVRLDDSLTRAAVAKAEGALAEAQAAASAQNIPRPQQIQAAEAAVASAKSGLEAAEAQLKRLQDIGARLVGSSSLADAQTAIERARADKHLAEAHLAEISELPASRKAAELLAKVKAADADLKVAKMQLELSSICSPIAGRLGRISVYLGQSLPVGTPVATVTDLRQIQLEASVPAKRIHQIQVGQPATITWGYDSSPETLAGKVTFVGQDIEPGTGSFPVTIVAENPDERLRSGLHVHARIVVRHLDGVLAVPRAAVIAEETEEPYVFVAEKQEGKLVPRRVPVKLGIRSGDLIQVEGKGLEAGATVVTTGNYALPDEAILKTDDDKKDPSEKPDATPKAKDDDK